LVISRTSEKSPTIYIHKTTTEQERDHSHINHLTVDGSFSSKKKRPSSLFVNLLRRNTSDVQKVDRRVCVRERKE